MDEPIFLIADDHGLFRKGVRAMIEQAFDGAQTRECPDADAAFALIEDGLRPTIVLLDLNMPGMGELRGLKAMHAAAPDIPIMVVSSSESPDDALAALDAGAVGYAPKSADSDVLVAAIRLCLNGGVYVPPLVLARLSRAPDDQAAPTANADEAAPLSTLTPRQRDVLALLAEGKSNKVIARALDVSEGTVKIHVAAILRALDVSNRAEAVNRAHRLGVA